MILKLHEIDPGECNKLWGKSMLFILPTWQQAAKIDVETLAPAPGRAAKIGDTVAAVPVGPSSAETWVMHTDPTFDSSNTPDSRYDPRIAWRPTGTIEILEAPREVDQIGRVSLKLKNGDFEIGKVLPVRICLPVE